MSRVKTALFAAIVCQFATAADDAVAILQKKCAGCHGPGGEGGRGAMLARPSLSRAPDDEALFHVIQRGIPGTEMPRAFAMNDHFVGHHSLPPPPAQFLQRFQPIGMILVFFVSFFTRQIDLDLQV